MMGFPCLRKDGTFFATCGRGSFAGACILKLPAARVLELIANGVGRPFAPAGRVFREWVDVPFDLKDEWDGLLREALEAV